MGCEKEVPQIQRKTAQIWIVQTEANVTWANNNNNWTELSKMYENQDRDKYGRKKKWK